MFFRRKKLDIDTWIKEYQKNPNARLLDVRTKEEYEEGHIPNSINIPLDSIRQYSETEDKELYVYCRSGARSAQAVRQLNAKGYHSKNIGGIIDYHGSLEN